MTIREIKLGSLFQLNGNLYIKCGTNKVYSLTDNRALRVNPRVHYLGAQVASEI